MNYQNSNIFNQPNNAGDWNFMDYSSNQHQQSTEAPLQEPVAFEDFQFSLGLDPEFAMPIPLDIPPPPPMNENDLFNMEAVPAPINHAVLDEQDHKAFSQFLDQFFVDPNMQIDPQFTMYDTQHPPSMSLDNHHHHHHQQQQPQHPYQHSDEEYHRQSSILQSLDEQKRYYNKDSDIHHQHQQNQQYQDRPGAIYLQQSNTITAPFIKPPVLRESSSLSKQQSDENDISNSPNSSHSSGTYGNNGNGNGNGGSGGGGGGAIRRGKPHKELLTEEEKRNNHIASEQKRRSMIRSGFKDLTEIVPTLKNINNSKSTVLFKAVDYIKYLDKRNRNLREKIKNLEVRVEVEGRMGILSRPTATSSSSSSSNNTAQPYYKSSSISTSLSAVAAAPRRVESNTNHNNINNNTTTSTTTSTNNTNNSNKTASAALLQHKTQQRQLMELQEKLQLHQKMLAQQQQQQQHQQQQQQQQQHQQQQQQKPHTTPVTTDINRPYHIYDQPHHHHRWHNEKTPETKMEVDTSNAAPSDSLIKATVSA